MIIAEYDQNMHEMFKWKYKLVWYWVTVTDITQRRQYHWWFLVNKAVNLTLSVPCIILQCVNDQRDAQLL